MYKIFFNKKPTKQNSIMNISTKLIYINPEDPRTLITPQRYEHLCQSIKDNGVLQPILLRKMPNELYQLICGANRLRAVKDLCIKTIPAITLELNDDEIRKIRKTKVNYSIDNDATIEIEKPKNLVSIEKCLNSKTSNARGSRDARIFLNTLFKAIDFVKTAGVNIFFIQKESNKWLEIKIKIKKE